MLFSMLTFKSLRVTIQKTNFKLGSGPHRQRGCSCNKDHLLLTGLQNPAERLDQPCIYYIIRLILKELICCSFRYQEKNT